MCIKYVKLATLTSNYSGTEKGLERVQGLAEKIHAQSILMQAYRVAGDVEGAETVFQKIGLGNDPYPFHILAALHASKGNLARWFPQIFRARVQAPGRIWHSSVGQYVQMHLFSLLSRHVPGCRNSLLVKVMGQGQGSSPDLV